MKTRIQFTEEWFPSLPHKECKCTIDGKTVTRGEFMRAICAVRILADETHSAARKTVRHVLAETP